MPVLEEERRAIFTVMAEAAGRVIVVNGILSPICPAAEIGGIATKLGSELHEVGESLFDLLQRISEAAATNVFEADGWDD